MDNWHRDFMDLLSGEPAAAVLQDEEIIGLTGPYCTHC